LGAAADFAKRELGFRACNRLQDHQSACTMGTIYPLPVFSSAGRALNRDASSLIAFNFHLPQVLGIGASKAFHTEALPLLLGAQKHPGCPAHLGILQSMARSIDAPPTGCQHR
jgi:hypothetical protein